MRNPVVHFEMPYRDRNRAARFYAEAFGWKIEKLGPEMNNHVVATTPEVDAKPGAPAGAINGGLIEYKADFVKYAEIMRLTKRLEGLQSPP